MSSLSVVGARDVLEDAGAEISTSLEGLRARSPS